MTTETHTPYGGPFGARSYSTSWQRRRVLPPDQLRTLPEWHMLVLHRTTPPSIARFLPVWERPDVIAFKTAAAQAAAAAAAGAAVPVTDPEATGA